MKERTRNTKLSLLIFVLIECCLIRTCLSSQITAPGNLVVTESRVQPHILELRWDPPVNYRHEIIGYKIYNLISTPESSSDWKVHAISGNDTFTSISAPELASPDTKYLFRLQAVARNRNGEVSEEFSYIRDICRMPREHGPCRESIQRYHYSSSHQSCVSFIYGGCGGNANNFETREECETRCGEGNPNIDICLMPGERGPCDEYVRRYYYIPSHQRCACFVYGGCGGNANNFETREKCEARCVRDICQLPREHGPCHESIQRYHYSPSHQSCVSFTYGGCGGNANNFETREECETRCGRANPNTDICQLPREHGPCHESIQRYHYSPSHQSCVSFIYGGCGGNANNFETREECETRCGRANPNTDICLMPGEHGPCSEYLQRYHYSQLHQSCVSFIYGGCGGNANNFESREECEARCVRDICQLPREHGPCRESIQRYHYSPSHQSCVSFIYGGCGGNANNFETREKCETRCGGGNPNIDICQLPREHGPCHESIQRYHYSPSHQSCVSFIYGGCGGNANNFETREECETRCGRANPNTDICLMPGEHGPCSEYLQRYHYSQLHQSCVSFIYGGCGGNANNFESREECEARCVRDICQLPREHGPCRESIQRYHYSPSHQSCVSFIYGGCGGNANNFETREKCETRCGGGNPNIDICQLPREHGPCHESIQRYHYSPSHQSCVSFIYGGCGGNANNFETREECETRCGRANPNTDICLMPGEHGPCSEYLQRYHYSQLHQSCVSFIYGGCGGNANNFESREECEARCVRDICQLPREHGPCRESIQRYHYSPSHQSCVSFIYGGCGGNANNFETREKCETRCGGGNPNIDICQLPREHGPCHESIQRYHYSPSHQSCVSFIYGGCGGNANNFETREECETRCGRANPNTDICLMPGEHGPCSEYLQRYHYSQLHQSCVSFIYGGCGGNANNFESREECEARCVRDICQLPREHGPCRESIQRYHYSPSHQSCVSFIYGGCGGNANNFETREKCETRCGGGNPNIDICLMPGEHGPCSEYLQRYHYSQLHQSCVSFIYGGCGGNANNFESREECEARCVRDICQLPREHGPCRESIQRYHYSPSHQSCVSFIYGGCGGNANNFETREKCETRCGGGNPNIDICQLPREHGPCHESIQRYHYSPSHQSCVSFIYGGCGGNANNFETREECETRCGRANPNTDICLMPGEHGPCSEYLQRYHYSQLHQSCVSFIYGGCGGNANNFESREECEARCVRDICQLPREHGPCRESIQRYHYSPSHQSCVSFIYGGCGGNANNFETREKCETRCGGGNPNIDICQLPREHGPCHESIQRYHYSPSHQSCVSFIYGGCGGNANNFETREECETRCGRANPNTDICLMPGEHGPCSEYLQRYHYSQLHQSCVSFIYGGCGGNANNFESREECEARCVRDICQLPREHGPCRESIQRYHYSPSHQSCVSFIYGGCGGNANNFETREKCETRCGGGNPNIDICQLPREHGPCHESIQRYHYSPSHQSCVSFIYGGCGGNANNFETREECETRCGRANPNTDICLMPGEHGPCSEYLQRYHYSQIHQSCVSFIYGGCGGNANNFETREECETRCGEGNPNIALRNKVCSQRKEKGPCAGNLQRYFYSPTYQRCLKFTYSGCGGNNNNFKTLSECERFCGESELRIVNSGTQR
ncbi:uncharacterized protein LOC143234563 isoform X6 [Tachypleus tridentatus]|uniref:uncharacterized protein LOC143234563 isoform X6 n=1 Tax=Tachypleus tridentatus TaxID=6853 RepID=UPI003FD1D5D2